MTQVRFFSCVQCFLVSVIHQTLTWTTGSLTCIRDHSYVCVHTHRGLGTPTTSQHSILTWIKRFSFFLVLQTGFEPLVFGSRVDALPIEPPRQQQSPTSKSLRSHCWLKPVPLLAMNTRHWMNSGRKMSGELKMLADLSRLSNTFSTRASTHRPSTDTSSAENEGHTPLCQWSRPMSTCIQC